MLKQLTSHIEDCQLLPPSQSSYRINYPNCSPGHPERFTNAGMDRALLLLDLSAAFDTVDHQRLLKRLAFTFGVTGSALGWLQLGRTQSVKALGVTSFPIRFLLVFRMDLCLARLFFPSTPFQPSLRDMDSVLSSFLATAKSTFISTWIPVSSLLLSALLLTGLLTLKIGLSTTVWSWTWEKASYSTLSLNVIPLNLWILRWW